MDPAAIGTAIIGLQAIARDEDPSNRRPRQHGRRTGPVGWRLAVADGLRTLADLVEPRRRETGLR
jgi:hypothetical protein